MSFEIERDVTIPGIQRTRGSKYPLSELSPGESFSSPVEALVPLVVRWLDSVSCTAENSWFGRLRKTANPVLACGVWKTNSLTPPCRLTPRQPAGFFMLL